MFMKKFFMVAALAAVALVSQSQAATLAINISPLDLSYDSTSYILSDATSASGGAGDSTQADPLGAMTFTLIPGGFQGVLLTNIFADVSIELDGPLVVGQAVNVIGGYFDLLTSLAVPGHGVAIDLTGGTVEATVTGDGVVGFILSVGDSDALTGDIFPGFPNTLNLGGPLTITFSGQTSIFSGVTPPQELEGLILDDFTSSGSADIRGNAVPEPSTYAMLGTALVGLGLLRRRKA
jgi:hypothetical protein